MYYNYFFRVSVCLNFDTNQTKCIWPRIVGLSTYLESNLHETPSKIHAEHVTLVISLTVCHWYTRLTLPPISWKVLSYHHALQLVIFGKKPLDVSKLLKGRAQQDLLACPLCHTIAICMSVERWGPTQKFGTSLLLQISITQTVPEYPLKTSPYSMLFIETVLTATCIRHSSLNIQNFLKSQSGCPWRTCLLYTASVLFSGVNTQSLFTLLTQGD